MGVQGLLKFVKSATRRIHLSDFAGHILAIDASSWLYKGMFAALDSDDPDAFLSHPLKMIALLQTHGVRPLLVFDGGVLPIKAQNNRQRQEERARYRNRAEQLRKAGKVTEAKKELRRAVGVSPLMARRLIDELVQLRVDFIVAPYEADAQLAFLVDHGHAMAAVTEDSDLLGYRCARVVYKLAHDTAEADYVEFDDLRDAENERGKHLFDGEWAGEWEAWRAGLFTDMCVLAGTDYLPSMRGVGVGIAHASMRDHRAFDVAVRHLAAKKRHASEGTEFFVETAPIARLVFEHQHVYDPDTGAVVPLRPLSKEAEGLDRTSLTRAIGEPYSREHARRICRDAVVDPVSQDEYAPFDERVGAARAARAAAPPAPAPVVQVGASAASAPVVPAPASAVPASAPAPSSAPSPAPASLAPAAQSTAGTPPAPSTPRAGPRADSPVADAVLRTMPAAAANAPREADTHECREAECREAAKAEAEAEALVAAAKATRVAVEAAGAEAAAEAPAVAELDEPDAARDAAQAAQAVARSRAAEEAAARVAAAVSAPGPGAAALSAEHRAALADVAEWAASAGNYALLERAAAEVGGLTSDACSTGAQLWLLHGALSAAVGAPAAAWTAEHPRVALGYLDRLRDSGVASNDAATTEMIARATECAWRQALLRPLREDPPSWAAFDASLRSAVRAAPAEIGAALDAELGPLRRRAPASDADADALRRVSFYSARHPASELRDMITRLLPTVRAHLPETAIARLAREAVAKSKPAPKPKPAPKSRPKASSKPKAASKPPPPKPQPAAPCVKRPLIDPRMCTVLIRPEMCRTMSAGGWEALRASDHGVYYERTVRPRSG